MTSAEHVQITFAVVGAICLLLVLILKGVLAFHINNEMIRQARGPEQPGRPQSALEAKQAYTKYNEEQPVGNLRKAKRTLVYGDAFLWIGMVAFLLIIWNIYANR